MTCLKNQKSNHINYTKKLKIWIVLFKPFTVKTTTYFFCPFTTLRNIIQKPTFFTSIQFKNFTIIPNFLFAIPKFPAVSKFFIIICIKFFIFYGSKKEIQVITTNERFIELNESFIECNLTHQFCNISVIDKIYDLGNKKTSDYLNIVFHYDFSIKINKSSLCSVFFNSHIKTFSNFSPFYHIHRRIIFSNLIRQYISKFLIYYIFFIIIANCRIFINFMIKNSKLTIQEAK